MSHEIANALLGRNPDDKIQLEYREKMQVLCEVIDEFFNEPGKPKQTCFALLIAPFGEKEGRVNYISNGHKKDMAGMLREYLKRAP